MPHELDPLIDAALRKEPEDLAVLADALLERDLIDPGPKAFLQYGAWAWSMLERTELTAWPRGDDPHMCRLSLDLDTVTGVLTLHLTPETLAWVKRLGALRLILRTIRGIMGVLTSSRGIEHFVRYTLESALRDAYELQGVYFVTLITLTQPRTRKTFP